MKVIMTRDRRHKDSAWRVLRRLIGPYNYDRARARYNLGSWPNIQAPKSFNEKLLHRKLLADVGFYSPLADKYKVRSYVEDRVGSRVLSRLYFVGANPEDIPFESLPARYVVKPNHTSGNIIFVSENHPAERQEIISCAKDFLSIDFAFLTNERWYEGIERKIIIEEYFDAGSLDVPFDYKFYCFHGKCHFIQVDIERFKNHMRVFYDCAWEQQPFGLRWPIGRSISRPENLEDMRWVAETLARDFDFVRVDLYSVNGQTKFGEMTFAPEAGWGPFNPREKDQEFGALW